MIKDGVIDGMISMADIAVATPAGGCRGNFRDQRTVFRNRRSSEDQVIQGGRLRSADAGRRIAGVRLKGQEPAKAGIAKTGILW